MLNEEEEGRIWTLRIIEIRDLVLSFEFANLRILNNAIEIKQFYGEAEERFLFSGFNCKLIAINSVPCFLIITLISRLVDGG